MTYAVGIPLRQRVFKASAWSFAGYGFSQVIRFGTNLVLTRFLTPDAFGVMAIATLVLVLLGLFSDVGLNLNVTQSKRGADPDYLNTVWAIQILRGAAISGIALAVALLLSLAGWIDLAPKDSVYADPRLPYVIAFVSLTALIGGAQSTKVYEARRHLMLGRITRIDIMSQFVGLGVTFAWLAVDRTVWALVAGWICSSLASMLMSHLWLPGISNRWTWDQSAFSEIIHFGKWIFLSSILWFLASNGDRIFLAGMVGSTMFGVYVIAFTVFSSIDQILGKIITDVTYPALSEIARDRMPDLKLQYYKLYFVIASCAYFSAGFLMISGDRLVSILYDSRYEDAGWMLQILALALIANPFRQATQSFLIFGAAKLYSYIHATRLITLYVSMPLGIHFFGLPGGVAGVALAYLSTLPQTIYFSRRFNLFDLSKELRVLPMIAVGVVAGLGFNFAAGYAGDLLHGMTLRAIFGK